jgi:ribosomal protein S15P/S13E
LIFQRSLHLSYELNVCKYFYTGGTCFGDPFVLEIESTKCMCFVHMELRPRGPLKIIKVPRFVGLAPEIPEDLYHLIKKAVAVRKHLERNRKDKDSKYRLILIESRIHRLSRYYKKSGMLPPVWKYEAASASALVA